MEDEQAVGTLQYIISGGGHGCRPDQTEINNPLNIQHQDFLEYYGCNQGGFVRLAIDQNAKTMQAFLYLGTSIDPVFHTGIWSINDLGDVEYQNVESVFVPSPTSNPSKSPTYDPTNSPTNNPSSSPSNNPTKSPFKSPTKSPSETHTIFPSKTPTKSPSVNPTESPTNNPSGTPSENPSQSPSEFPTNNPAKPPTISPSSDPTNSPSKNLSNIPTNIPTKLPTDNPTFPTKNPSNVPTKDPTINPITSQPTYDPTKDPIKKPATLQPIFSTLSPTSDPTSDPTETPITTTPTITIITTEEEEEIKKIIYVEKSKSEITIIFGILLCYVCLLGLYIIRRKRKLNGLTKDGVKMAISLPPNSPISGIGGSGEGSVVGSVVSGNGPKGKGTRYNINDEPLPVNNENDDELYRRNTVHDIALDMMECVDNGTDGNTK